MAGEFLALVRISVALWAHARNFDRVFRRAEPVLCGDLRRPALGRGPSDLDGCATHAADEVVMVSARTQAVTRLTIVGDDDVYRAISSESLKRTVDGGQTHRFFRLAQQIMNLLSAAKVLDGGQRADDRGALLGVPPICCSGLCKGVRMFG